VEKRAAGALLGHVFVCVNYLCVYVLHCWRAHHIVDAAQPALDRNRSAAFVAKFNERARMQQRWLALPGANEIFLSLCMCEFARDAFFSDAASFARKSFETES
jgi:hypothetical protein